MIKKLISARNEDYTFFIQCSCGNEIIQFYYYKESNIDNEIIGIRYFGHLPDLKDSRCANFTFTRSSFYSFIEATERALRNDIIHGVVKDGLEYLVFDKDKYGFYTLLKARSNMMLKKKQYVWDISLRESEVKLIYEELLNMKNFIEEGFKKKC